MVAVSRRRPNCCQKPGCRVTLGRFTSRLCRRASVSPAWHAGGEALQTAYSPGGVAPRRLRLAGRLAA